MPRYTPNNLHPPHDLHYSWSGWPSAGAFPRLLLPMNPLSEALAADGTPLESHTWSPDMIHLTVAAPPDLAPVRIAQRLKGRLDHALRKAGTPVSFSRKVGVRAIGHNCTAVVERYVRDQLEHVDLADSRYRATLAAAAIHDPAVDLADPAVVTHGRYWYNLHVVFVVARRYRIGGQGLLQGLRERVRAASAARGCALKRMALMPDHMHLALRGNPRLSPSEIALSLQEATSVAAGCRLWEAGFYVGTFGDYDCATVGAQGGVRR